MRKWICIKKLFFAGLVLSAGACVTPPPEVACQCTPQVQAVPVSMATESLPAEAQRVAVSAASLPSERERLDLDVAVTQLNDTRAGLGLPGLRLSDPLMQAARAHAADMASVDDVSHTGSDGAGLAERLERAGYDPLLAEENLSGGQRDFTEALAAWLESPDHRRRLMNPGVTELGIAVSYDPSTRYRTFWALILADPF